MPGYTKLFDSLLTSTIWCGQDAETKVVWITMLAMVNRDGIVESTVPGLAKMAEVPIAKVEEAIYKLAQPDNSSRTKDHNGRRIEEVDGGWRLLNYDLYRWKSSAEDAADRARRYRLRKKRALMASQKRNDSSQNSDFVMQNHATHIAEEYIPPISPLKTERHANVTVSNNSSIEKKNQTKTCAMPGCDKPAELNQAFCSDACYEYAVLLETKYGNGKIK